ncbi:DODA-type extradiol aromatic ring-opening family dioxygenase [Catenovulum sediminis]|uniref:DODA-type extradiol aromatic ring-opening family dioxygenase n=1 Tax=Catenovulum sediminis TaxID=1740262 RepID=UPI001C8F3D7E|nr:class III extradiol ring-cleavage dioxygenase [Catenovulum sediminis]
MNTLNANQNKQQGVLFVSHGGGPLPLLGHPSHWDMLDTFRQIKQQLTKPKNILLLSAHWESDCFEIQNNENPALIYDYSGFADEAYQISYPAAGDTELAQQVKSQLDKAGLPTRYNASRGYDHGMFVPLKLLWPEADVPVVQVSLQQHLNPQQHIKLGESLKVLREQGTLIIGSGFSFHNLNVFMRNNNMLTQQADAFHHWLDRRMSSNDWDYQQAKSDLIDWQQAPSAQFNHPREEHLLPLHVCFGAAQTPADQVFRFTLNNWPARCYLWR